MEGAENEQRSYGDRFWGYDGEKDNRYKEMSSMGIEEKRSRAHDALRIAIEIQSTWEQEIKEEQYSESFVKALEQVQERRKYLKTVFSTDTSQQIIDYQWSTRLKIRPSSDVSTSSESSAFKKVKSINNLMPKPPARSIAPPIDSLTGLQTSVNKSSSSSSLQRKVVDMDQSSPTPIRSQNMPAAGEQQKSSLYGGSGSLALLMRQHQDGPLDLTGNSEDSATTTSKHVDSLEGHPDFKWDQEVLLKKSFQELCQSAMEGTPVTSSSHTLILDDINQLGELISSNYNVRKMLRYTVFGSWIKRKEWSKFGEALSERTRLTTVTMADRHKLPDMNMNINAADWLLMARDHAAKENSVERRLIRTNEEHNLAAVDTVKYNRWCDRKEHLTHLSRTIIVGNMVWCLHGKGSSNCISIKISRYIK